MISTVFVYLSSNNPAKPLSPVAVMKGSAATVTVVGASPRCTSVVLKVTNPTGTAATYSATRDSQGWIATIPASHFAVAGASERGFQVWGSGVDETNTAREWGLGEGDLEVLPTDGTTGTVGDYTTVKVQSGTPGDPLPEELRKIGGVWKIYHGGAWEAFGGGTGTVTSVNNVEPVNGNVTLTAANVGAVATDSHSKLVGFGGTDYNTPFVKRVDDVLFELYTKPAAGIPATDMAAAVQTALTNARTPTAHKSTHATGGTDALSPSDIGAAARSNPTLSGAVTIEGPGGSASTVLTAQGGQLIIGDKTASTIEDLPYKSSIPGVFVLGNRVVMYYKVVADTPLPIVLPELPAAAQTISDVVNLDIVIDTIGVTTLPTITINGATVGGTKQTIYASGGALPEIKVNSINVIDATSIPALGAWVVMGAVELTAVTQS